MYTFEILQVSSLNQYLGRKVSNYTDKFYRNIGVVLSFASEGNLSVIWVILYLHYNRNVLFLRQWQENTSLPNA